MEWTFSALQSRKMTTESSIGKSFSFPTRLLSPSGSAVQASTSWSRNPARSLGQALVKNHGHDVLARSARTPVLSAMSALNASAVCVNQSLLLSTLVVFTG